jgi:hypothetical protein
MPRPDGARDLLGRWRHMPVPRSINAGGVRRRRGTGSGGAFVGVEVAVEEPRGFLLIAGH